MLIQIHTSKQTDARLGPKFGKCMLAFFLPSPRRNLASRTGEKYTSVVYLHIPRFTSLGSMLCCYAAGNV